MGLRKSRSSRRIIAPSGVGRRCLGRRAENDDRAIGGQRDRVARRPGDSVLAVYPQSQRSYGVWYHGLKCISGAGQIFTGENGAQREPVAPRRAPARASQSAMSIDKAGMRRSEHNPDAAKRGVREVHARHIQFVGNLPLDGSRGLSP